MLTPALMAAGCGRFAFRSPEVLLFSTVGYRYCQNYTLIAEPASGEVRAFLTPSGGKSYPSAPARSLHGPVAVVVHEHFPGGQVIGDIIELYWPPRRWRRLWYRPPGSPGQLVMSPDATKVAAVFRPQPDQYSHISIFPLSGDDPLDVSELIPAQGRVGDVSPDWSPNGEQLVLRRIDSTAGVRDQTIELPCLHIGTRRVSVLRAARPQFLIACYGPDGPLLERDGLSLRKIAPDGAVSTLLDHDAIPGAMPIDLGLAYSFTPERSRLHHGPPAGPKAAPV
ncbi:MAG: hypothetical protein ACRD1C_08255 [Terriglobales bacterium]